MKRVIHPIAGTLSLLTIITFWLSTAVGELLGSQATVVAIKTTIPWGFVWLVPALVATGVTGLVMARGRRAGLIGKKLARMPWIAANGILILMPAALFLAYKARAGEFDAAFHAVQAVELAAGAANIMLLSLNMRDGLRMTHRLRRRQVQWSGIRSS
jgi:hypothetical protein